MNLAGYANQENGIGMGAISSRATLAREDTSFF
jgi:hypothetical protein